MDRYDCRIIITLLLTNIGEFNGWGMLRFKADLTCLIFGICNIYFIFRILSVDGESARNPYNSTLLPSSALQPCKHLVSCVGLLRSRPDPVDRSKIEQDKASTSGKRPLCFSLTRSFKSA